MGEHGTEHHQMKLRSLQLVLALLFAAAMQGAEEPPATNQFKVFSRPEWIPERGPIPGQVMRAEGRSYFLLPPRGWNATANAAERSLTFLPEDQSASIRVRIRPLANESLETLESDTTKTKLLALHPNGVLVRSFKCHTSARAGVAYDIERQISNLPPITTRTAFVPFDQDLVEFTLTAETKRLSQFRWFLGNLMSSFRLETAMTTER